MFAKITSLVFILSSFMVNFMNASESSPIKMKEIRENGIVGKIYYPNAKGPRPAIILLSGSDGGFHERSAKLFAEEGYIALALAYFHAEGLPEHLENIPLEYFKNATEWLKAQPEVNKDKVHLHGPSRGGELALLLASIYPKEYASVVAIVPSCVTYAGMPDVTKSAWTLAGKPLPAAPAPGEKEVYKQLETSKTVDLVQIFLEMMEDKGAFENAFIQVEKIECPILLISGMDDRMWPSYLYCELIIKRLVKYDSQIFRDHVSYDNAGHMITSNYDVTISDPIKHPVTGLFYEVGGNPESQAFACKDAWYRIIDFLNAK